MPANFWRITGLVASLYAVSSILVLTTLYLAEQSEVSMTNFGLIGGLASWGVVVLAFRGLGQSLLHSLSYTVLSVILVVILATFPITTFEIGLHHYIDPDYKHRLAARQATVSQKKMYQIETEKNVFFTDTDEEDYLNRLVTFYSIKGLIRSQLLGMLMSSVLLIFLVLLLGAISGPVNDY